MDPQNLINDFEKLNDWQEKYSKIIAMGKELPKLSEEFKTEELKVKGCQSQVWLKAGLNDESKVVFQGESDSMIVQGLLAILISVYSNRRAGEILKIDPKFLEDLGLKKHLSPNRANGVYSMVKQILLYAQAFKALEK
jgi:cysteine desulfuration protein SufE